MTRLASSEFMAATSVRHALYKQLILRYIFIQLSAFIIHLSSVIIMNFEIRRCKAAKTAQALLATPPTDLQPQQLKSKPRKPQDKKQRPSSSEWLELPGGRGYISVAAYLATNWPPIELLRPVEGNHFNYTAVGYPYHTYIFTGGQVKFS